MAGLVRSRITSLHHAGVPTDPKQRWPVDPHFFRAASTTSLGALPGVDSSRELVPGPCSGACRRSRRPSRLAVALPASDGQSWPYRFCTASQQPIRCCLFSDRSPAVTDSVTDAVTAYLREPAALSSDQEQSKKLRKTAHCIPRADPVMHKGGSRGGRRFKLWREPTATKSTTVRVGPVISLTVSRPGRRRLQCRASRSQETSVAKSSEPSPVAALGRGRVDDGNHTLVIVGG